MAYNRRNNEHAFQKIGKDIKTGRIPGLVLLCGKEEYLVDFYAQMLIGKYVNKACEALDLVTLDRDSVTIGKIIENMETMPLMSERKVVYLPDFIDSRAKMPKAFADSSRVIEEFEEYISDFGEGMLLLITVSRQDDERNDNEIRRSKFFKAVEKARKAGIAEIYDFEPLNPEQLRSFIEKRFRASGKQFRPGIVSMITREAGYGNKNIDYGLFNLDNDLKKIIAHCGDSPEITPADVSGVLTVNPENNVFAMIDAIGRNRKDEAFRLLHNLLRDGSSEFQLLGMITRQLELMLTTCEMKDEGKSLAEIQKILKKDKIHEFRTQKALEAGSRFSRSSLKAVLAAAYEVEPNIKTGLMSGQLALEYFIAGI